MKGFGMLSQDDLRKVSVIRIINPLVKKKRFRLEFLRLRVKNLKNIWNIDEMIETLPCLYSSFLFQVFLSASLSIWLSLIK